MTYDFYVAEPSNGDVFTQLRLLVTKTNSVNAAKEFVQLVHSGRQSHSQYGQLIARQMSLMQKIGLASSSPNLSLLPPGSWFLQFTFTLAKPWISKDDDTFYVAESVNPVRKDKVFKVPVMAASSWKGLLRWTLMQARLAMKKDTLTPELFAQERFGQTLLLGDEQGEEPGQVKGFAEYVDSLKPEAKGIYRKQVRSRFGEGDKDNEQGKADVLPSHSGRLRFYATFYDKTDVEVINPHSRETRAGTHPIYLECVPAGATGTFSLLYVPFDLIGQDEDTIRKQAAQDLQIVAEGLEAMFLTYGFSAKRTSGFGVADAKLKDGKLSMNAPDLSPTLQATTEAPAEPLPKYLEAPGKLKPEYLNPDGTFRERNQEELNKMPKSQRQEYDKAKKWWEREGKTSKETPQAEAEAAPPTPETKPCIERNFNSFNELKARVEELASIFKAGGEP